MTYEEINDELEEISNIEFHLLNETEIEDTKIRLVDLGEIADKINDDDESDGEFTEIMETIEDLVHMINEELDEREDEEDYGY